MDLTLTRLRPVQVFVLGEVARPGGYTVSSNSTPFNVLYSVGGPLTSGSLRSVQVVRGGRVLGTVDIYNYLLKGYDKNPIRLQSNDFIFIPPREVTVSIEGDVYRPAIYELREGEGMAELLAYAGGLLPDAYTKRFQVDRIIPFDRRTDPSIARELLDFSLERVIRGEETVHAAGWRSRQVCSRSWIWWRTPCRLPVTCINRDVMRSGLPFEQSVISFVRPTESRVPRTSARQTLSACATIPRRS